MDKLKLIAITGPYEGRCFVLESFPCSIGKKPENTICLANDRYISSKHCEIGFVDDGYWLTDLKSTNGTYVNGVKITNPTRLVPRKCTISMGRSQLLFDTDANMAIEESRTKALQNVLANDSILIPSTGLFNRDKLEESLFVADICNSTEFANKNGESALLKVVHAIAKSVMRNAELNHAQFLKCTGDGFFATFSNTKQALKVALHLLEDMDKFSWDKTPVDNPGVRIAIHRGLVSTDQAGDRLGLACHLVFRLEGAKGEEQVNPTNTPINLPEKNRILLTDEATNSLGNEMLSCFVYVGDFIFKGFSNPVKVNMLVDNRKAFLLADI